MGNRRRVIDMRKYIAKHEEFIKTGGRRVFIYGAKVTAKRCAMYLKSCGVEVVAFLVSARYDNPQEILGLPVWRIEEHARDTFDVVICAVSEAYTAEVLDELERYHIAEVLELAPNLVDTFPWRTQVTQQCQIAEEAHIAESVCIFADEASSIVIAPDVFVEGGTKITAVNGAQIRIDAGARIGQGVSIRADGEQTQGNTEKGQAIIRLGRHSSVGDRCQFAAALDDAHIVFGDSSEILADSKVWAFYGGQVVLGDTVHVGYRAALTTEFDGKFKVGRGTTIEDDFYVGATKTDVVLGAYNMLSFHIKINTGGHEILDNTTREPITNRKPIVTEDHVWIGMGATLLQGSHIGYGGIVGASAVVTKPFPDHCSVAGNPAHIIKENIDWQRWPVSVVDMMHDVYE